MGDLLLPVGERRMSSWAAHQRRVPRSSEAGTDFYCPIGTPIVAPADGRVYGSGSSIVPASGRWIGIDLDNGMRFRAMHLSRLVNLGRTVKRGQVIGYSGASGYGEENWSWNPNTGGAHTHVTLWPTHASRYGYDNNGRPYTVDFMNYVGGTSGGGSGSGEWDEMATEEQVKKAVRDGVFEVLTGADLGPGGRNHYDSLKFLGEIVAQRATKQDAADATVEVLTGYRAGPGERNVLDSLKFVADLSAATFTEAQVKVIADAVAAAVGKPTVTLDYAAIAKAVNDDSARRLAS